MNHAKLNARWHGHQIGTVVHGTDADKAVAAGRAEPVAAPKRRKVTTGTKPSPTRETDRGASDDTDGTGPDG